MTKKILVILAVLAVALAAVAVSTEARRGGMRGSGGMGGSGGGAAPVPGGNYDGNYDSGNYGNGGYHGPHMGGGNYDNGGNFDGNYELPPGNYDVIEVSVSMDKGGYVLGEPIEITVTAHNPNSYSIGVDWAGCYEPLGYTIDGYITRYDVVDENGTIVGGGSCDAIGTYVFQPRETIAQTFTRYADPFGYYVPLPVGRHGIVGTVGTGDSQYGSDPVMITVVEKEVSVSTDEEEYITNSVVSDGTRVKVINNLDSSIYFYSGCADPALDIYELKNGEWSKQVKPIVCGAIPSVNELKPKQNITLGVLINEEGEYKVSFSYSLTKVDASRIGDQIEVFSNSFTVKSIIPTLDNSLELCEERGDFTSVGGHYYPYYACIRSVAIWIADKDADKAVELCDKSSDILGQQDYTCYQFIAEIISEYDGAKAIEICDSIEYSNQRDICFKRIE